MVFTNKRGNYSCVKLKNDFLNFKMTCTSAFILFSLNSITCSGSMGIISARYLEHPFETVAKI